MVWKFEQHIHDGNLAEQKHKNPSLRSVIICAVVLWKAVPRTLSDSLATGHAFVTAVCMAGEKNE
jgi:hypothetical protein